MFTWICPTCGREVPPAYNECPDCTKPAADQPAAQPDPQAPPPPPQAAAPPPPPQYQPPPQQYQPPPPQSAPPPPPQYAPPQYAPPSPVQVYPYQTPAPAPRGGLPTWLLTIVFALAFFGLVAGVYWLVGAAKGTNTKPTAAVESPAAKPNAKTSPYQKYIEIAGVRFVENAKKKGATEARFVIVNHSSADLTGLGGNVTVWGRTRNSEEDAAGTFAFTTDLKAFESKELSAPLNTKLKIYELPDWQNVSADVQITAPQ